MKKILIVAILILTCIRISAQVGEIFRENSIHYGDNFPAGKYLNIRGVNLYFETYGQGEPLLLIHGNGGSIASFQNQIPFFSARYKVIAVDSRAQGKSTDTGDSLTFEMMADDFSTLLDSLHLDSCYIIGWSDGGINGLMLAMRHPEKVRKLAITGANLWPDTTAISPVDFNWMTKAYKDLEQEQQTPEIKNTRKLIRLDLTEPHITRDQLQIINCPTLVIAGDHDIILTGHTVFIAESIRGSNLFIVPGSSHSTLIDQKDLFNRVVLEFFEKK
ncbi:MAG: alpha/beta hydrolase [Bacteroidales bacterium]|nr:alpha/beta hydrolase [Bacteroidales bacterium]